LRINSFSVCRQKAARDNKSKRRPRGPADRNACREPAVPRSGGAPPEPVNNKAANNMNRKKTACAAQRLNASHVVEAELEHLDWATKQPAQRLLDAVYWRRRVLAVKCGFELTELQVMRLEKILQRLGHSPE
jgi:hypothetical protein